MVEDIAENLYFGEDGIWHSKKSSPISYSPDGNSRLSVLQQNSFWFNYRNKVIGEVMSKYLPAFPFFDLGGGTGFVSKYIQDNFGECVLVEPQIEGYLQAKDSGIRNIIASTISDAGFKENIMASCGMFDVLEHVEDDSRLLRELWTTLTINGKIFITVPALPTLWSDEDVAAGHFRRHTTSSVHKLLSESGFEIEYISYFFSYLILPLFIFRSIPSILGFKRKVSDMRKLNREHNSRTGLVEKYLRYLMKNELQKIRSGKPVKRGTSIIAVGKKTVID